MTEKTLTEVAPDVAISYCVGRIKVRHSEGYVHVTYYNNTDHDTILGGTYWYDPQKVYYEQFLKKDWDKNFKEDGDSKTAQVIPIYPDPKMKEELKR